MFDRLSACVTSFVAIFFVIATAGCGMCGSDGDAQSRDAGADVVSDVDDDECTYQAECADDEFCHDGDCHEAPECDGTNRWEPCLDDFEEFDEELARRAYCNGTHCQIVCLHDEECPEQQLCSENGQCIPFTGQLTGEHPGGDDPVPLRAGFADVLLNFPIGLSLGGYGSRAASNDGRYVHSLEASHGKMHGLFARGVALDDGTRTLVFLRAPIIFPSAALHEAVARKLQDHTGDDWRSSLVISGTHTHSGPARFWQLPEDSDLGMLGIDEFNQQAFDWLANSLAQAALDAVDDLSPARMGWEVVEEFDNDDVISSDRWSEIPPFDDNRVLLIRIDEPDGTPRGLLVSFGTHGTVHSGSYANNDVMVGIEKKLEYALGDAYDRHIPVLYFNQNGGSMSPRGDRAGHDHAQVFESLGAHLVDRTFEAIESMNTTDDWTLRGHTLRFPILHEYLEYSNGPFDDYVYGALMCNPGGDPDSYGCLLGLHRLLDHRPFTLFSRSQISAFELNDLTLVTMPGELSMPLGWQVQRELRDEFGIDPFDSFTWGYAQDHLLYLLPTNLRGELPPFPGISTPKAPQEYPDYSFSYVQGGYEAQMSPWGHNLGDFLVERAVEAVGLMRGDYSEPTHPEQYPDEFTTRDHDPFPVESTDADQVATITSGPPAQVERRQFVEIAWLGGDPGAEMPQAPRATLERLDEDTGQFEALELRNHRPYDNREFVMLTRLRFDDQGRPEWVVYWEERADFPTGTYRFSIQGHYLDADTGDRTAYETTTDSFELVPLELMIDELEFADESTITFRLSYPPAQTLSTSGPSEDRGQPSGSYRMHHRQVPTGAAIPVDAEGDFSTMGFSADRQGPAISVEDASVTTDGESVAGYDDVPVTRIQLELNDELDEGEEIELFVEIEDNYGNAVTLEEILEYNP